MIIDRIIDDDWKIHKLKCKYNVSNDCIIDNMNCNYANKNHFLVEDKEHKNWYDKLCTVDLLKQKIIKIETNLFNEKIFIIKK